MRKISIRFTLIMALSAALLLQGLPLTAIGEVTPTPTGLQDPPATATPLPPTPMPPAPGPGLTDIDARLDEAVQAIQANDYERAIEIMNGVINQTADNAEAYLIRGIAYLQTNRSLRAVDDFSRAIDLIPYNGSFYTFRGDALAIAGDTGAAMDDYNRSIFLNPRDPQTYISRGTLYNNQGQSSLAQIDSLIAQGLTTLNFGNSEAAQRLFSQAIDLGIEQGTPSAEAYYNRGLAWLMVENEIAAISDLSEALEIDAQMQDAYLARGIAERLNGNGQAAGRDFLRRMELLENTSSDETISRGESLDVLMAYGVVYRIRFEASGGDVISISARDRDGVMVDPLITLLDSNGLPLIGDDDFGGQLDSLIESFRLPADGSYTIMVSHANGGFDGPVRVELR